MVHIPFFNRSDGKPEDEFDEFFGPPVLKGSVTDGHKWTDAVGKNVQMLKARPTQQPEPQRQLPPPQQQPRAEEVRGMRQQQQPSRNEPIAAPHVAGAGAGSVRREATAPQQQPPQQQQRGGASQDPTSQRQGQVPPQQQQQAPTMYAGVSFNNQPPVPFLAPFPVNVGAQVVVEGEYTGVVAFITPQTPPQPCHAKIIRLVEVIWYAGVKMDQDGQVIPHIAPFQVQQGMKVVVEGGRTGEVTFVTSQSPPNPCTIKILRPAEAAPAKEDQKTTAEQPPQKQGEPNTSKNEPLHSTSSAPQNRSPARPHDDRRVSPGPPRQNSATRLEVKKSSGGGFKLPDGKWDSTEDPEFFWSDEEELYFHTGSGHYYDPESEQYYNPETEEWYTED